MKNIPVGNVLVQNGYVTEEQVAQALEYQKKHSHMRLGAVMMEMGFVTEKQLLEALAVRMHLKMTDLNSYVVEIDAVAKIPRQIATRYNLIAVSAKGNQLQIVMSDPLDFYAVEDVRQITQMSLEIMLDLTKNIHAAIDYYYAEIEAREAAERANAAVRSEEKTLDLLETSGDEAPVVQMVNSLLARGYSINASDIHIEPFETHISVRMRVDGVIGDYVTLSKTLHTSLVARVKILANMDIAERRIPQDGYIKTHISDDEVSARVSTIPTVFGEKVVIRFLSTQSLIDHFEHYGMTEENYAKIKQMLGAQYGIVYITGPTGSGKTTTLYMILEELAKKQVNISTIEDPVERNLKRVNQVQVNNTAGLTFERGLRSLLRQDPDVIMVGETRDNETAAISVRAAITGHLVFSTLHTNDAISTIVRLMDMGVPAYLVANSIVGLVAQRLVRKVCPSCGYDYTPDETELAFIGKHLDHLRAGKGCHLCNNTGYKGRIAVHEVVIVDKEIRRMIATGARMDEIYEYARSHQGFRTLRDSALQLLEEGVTSLEEYSKVAYYFD